jgi:hypothetical protein
VSSQIVLVCRRGYCGCHRCRVTTQRVERGTTGMGSACGYVCCALLVTIPDCSPKFEPPCFGGLCPLLALAVLEVLELGASNFLRRYATGHMFSPNSCGAIKLHSDRAAWFPPVRSLTRRRPASAVAKKRSSFAGFPPSAPARTGGEAGAHDEIGPARPARGRAFSTCLRPCCYKMIEIMAFLRIGHGASRNSGCPS